MRGRPRRAGFVPREAGATSVLATAGVGILAALIGGIAAHALDVGSVLQFVIAVALALVLVPVLGRTRLARV